MQSQESEGVKVGPGDIARALRQSIGSDHAGRVLDPLEPGDLMELARWGRALGLEGEARKWLDRQDEAGLGAWVQEAAPGVEPTKYRKALPFRQRLKDEELALYLRLVVSPHPEAFAEKVEACRAMEAYILRRSAERMEGCGEAWGRIVHLFWKDRKGREQLRKTLGVHECKHRWCPRHGKRQQVRRSDEIERVLEAAQAWGFTEAHIRFLTVTIPNGKDVNELRAWAHGSWAKLQRGRWWPRHVFGWFRCTETTTGTDGNWNLHLHMAVILWTPFISYQHLWDVWEKATGQRCRVDIDTLRDLRAKAKGRGLTRAAHYLTKYLTKAEDLQNLAKGPGGLAHVVSATRKMRMFSMGGGCSVVRRMLPGILPTWALRAEMALQDAHIVGGMPPVRAEEVDPRTGEVTAAPAPSPFLARDREKWATVGRALEQMEDTVGIPCGPRKRFRRIGHLPLASSPPTVAAYLAAYRRWIRSEQAQGRGLPKAYTITKAVPGGWGGSWERVPVRVCVRTRSLGPPILDLAPGQSEPVTITKAGQVVRVAVRTRPGAIRGVRGVIADGCWKLFRWEEWSKTSQRWIRRAAVLPAIRYAWRTVARALRVALSADVSEWGRRRRKAFTEAADVAVGDMERVDAVRAATAALDDREAVQDGGQTHWTTKRRRLAVELQNAMQALADSDLLRLLGARPKYPELDAATGLTEFQRFAENLAILRKPGVLEPKPASADFLMSF